MDKIGCKHTEYCMKCDIYTCNFCGCKCEDKDPYRHLYPKWNCNTCGDWFHMPYKFCKCETERLNKPTKEVFVGVDWAKNPDITVAYTIGKCPYCVEPCGNEWCAWRYKNEN